MISKVNDFFKKINCGPSAPACIAFIGSVGVPNCYGGFESFLEAIAPVISDHGVKVLVTCDTRRYANKNKYFSGVERVFVNIPANGPLSSLHDIVAFLKVFYKSDAVVVLGVSAGPFFLLMRLLAILFSKKLIINIDGVEWRRKKFSKKVRLILWAFDLFAQISAGKIIYDNRGLLPYIHKCFQKKSVCIPYSGDHVLRFPISKDQQIDSTALTICRIEPENNIEMLINAALESQLSLYTIIGNWRNSVYGRNLQVKYAGCEKLLLLDPIYDAALIAQYRNSCSIYLHGHSVGGTNPSLVEMLFYNCQLLCFDCVFNRETADDKASYFNDKDSLTVLINSVLQSSIDLTTSTNFETHAFTAEVIASQYLQIADILYPN